MMMPARPENVLANITKPKSVIPIIRVMMGYIKSISKVLEIWILLRFRKLETILVSLKLLIKLVKTCFKTFWQMFGKFIINKIQSILLIVFTAHSLLACFLCYASGMAFYYQKNTGINKQIIHIVNKLTIFGKILHN